MSDMNVQELARHAQDLLDNPVFRRAFEEVRQRYTYEWRNSPSNHPDHRENCYNMMRAVDRLEQHLQEFVNSGQLESARVKRTVKGE